MAHRQNHALPFLVQWGIALALRPLQRREARSLGDDAHRWVNDSE
jgi:hypothetical protein